MYLQSSPNTFFQTCKFQVGSYSYDDTKMVFVESGRVKGYVETSRSIVLDYDVHIAPLSQRDRDYGISEKMRLIL